MRKALVDQGFKSSVVSYGAAVGIDVQVVERKPGDRGSSPAETLGGGADVRHLVLPPAPGPRLRAPASPVSLSYWV